MAYCVVWDLSLTFLSQIIWLIQPHNTVILYNIIKWGFGLNAVNQPKTSMGSSGNQFT